MTQGKSRSGPFDSARDGPFGSARDRLQAATDAAARPALDADREQAGIEAADALLRLSDCLQRGGKTYGAREIAGLVRIVTRWSL